MATPLTTQVAYLKEKYEPKFQRDYSWHHYELKEFFLDIIKTFEMVEDNKQDKGGM